MVAAGSSAAAVALVLVGVALLRDGGAGGGPADEESPAQVLPVDVPAVPPSLGVSWLEAIEEADEGEPLPESGPVGAAAMVYRLCEECATGLLMADGRRFTLPEPDFALLPHYSVSPDGRWLAARDGAGGWIRDLTGSTVYEVDGATGQALVPWAWGVDSRWVIFGDVELAGGGPEALRYLLVDLVDGSVAEVPAAPGREVVGVLGSGHLVALASAVRSPAPVTSLEVELWDSTGAVVHGFTVEPGEWLQRGETLASAGTFTPYLTHLFVSPDGQGLRLAVFGSDTPSLSILEVDLDGQVRSRVEVPEEGPMGWRLLGQVDGELVVAISRTDLSTGTHYFRVFAVDGGSLRELTTLEGDPGIVARVAGTGYYGGASS